MREDVLFVPEEERVSARSITARDIVRVGFRHKRALLACFCTVSIITVLYALVIPPKYESESKILFKRDRVDPIISPEKQSPVLLREAVSEEELNSEVEIILSDDVLRQVVVSCSLQKQNPRLAALFSKPQGNDPETTITAAARKLKHGLAVEPLKKTNIIQLRYRVRDPQLATQVLRALDAAYLERRMAVYRPYGELTFFEQKTTEYRNNLKLAEDRLQKFSREAGSVKPELVRDITLQKLTDFNAILNDTRATIAATENRIRMLHEEARTTPTRMTTVVRRLDNPELLKELKNTLLNLELKRIDLLGKYEADYRPVRMVEEEITKTKTALAAQETALLRDESTDVDPTHRWVDEELAKAKADLTGLQAHAARTEKIIREYQATVHDLQDKGMGEQDLLREAKAAEDNYLLYLRKSEEARIADALDQRHIFNVAIAEEPTIPVGPVYPPWYPLLFGFFLAGMLSAGLVFTLDYLDSSFRSPQEVEAALSIPVLAAVSMPENGKRNGLTAPYMPQ